MTLTHDPSGALSAATCASCRLTDASRRLPTSATTGPLCRGCLYRIGSVRILRHDGSFPNYVIYSTSTNRTEVRYIPGWRTG